MSHMKRRQLLAEEADLPDQLPANETIVLEGGINQLNPFTQIVTYEEYQMSQSLKQSTRNSQPKENAA